MKCGVVSSHQKKTYFPTSYNLNVRASRFFCLAPALLHSSSSSLDNLDAQRTGGDLHLLSVVFIGSDPQRPMRTFTTKAFGSFLNLPIGSPNYCLDASCSSMGVSFFSFFSERLMDLLWNRISPLRRVLNTARHRSQIEWAAVYE